MSNLDARLAGFHSPVLSAFRIIFGLLFTIHGSQKLFGWPVAAPGGTAEVGSFPFWWAGLIEFVLGILITVGFFTRIAAFIASGEMAFAYFYQHWPPLKGGGASFWPIANGGAGDHVLLRVSVDRDHGCGHVVGRRAPAWRRASRQHRGTAAACRRDGRWAGVTATTLGRVGGSLTASGGSQTSLSRTGAG